MRRGAQSAVSSTSGRRSPLRNVALARLCRARDLLAAPLDARVPIRDAAREAAVSPYHFIRVFRGAFGETPHAFRTRVRIERARHLLAAGGHSVTEVCLAVGYESPASFSHLFLRHTGMAPAEYRRRVRALVQVPGHLPPQLIPHCYAAMFCAPRA